MSGAIVRNVPRVGENRSRKNNRNVTGKIIPIGNDVRMIYLNITKPLDYVIPQFIIGRVEYQRIMKERREKTATRSGIAVEDGPKWINLNGEMILPWAFSVDFSEFVPSLLKRGFKLVGTEHGLSRDGESKKIWLTFVQEVDWKPPVEEYKSVKPLVMKWLEEEMLAPDRRMNVTVHLNPLKRPGAEAADPTAKSVSITIDRDGQVKELTGGLNLRLADNGLILAKGPARQ